ncbi:LytR C-terminal domain-containing protein [Patescibacteria group bacterium]|nr:LytR C-terminal domain-containing protein [Patescibacteria group bacterium]
MSIFKSTKIVLWPKKDIVDIYLNQKDNNSYSFNLNLWEERTAAELVPLTEFFKDHPKEVLCCLSDEVTITKSFIYDTKIEKIDKKEVKALAESSITFPLDPDYIDFELDQSLPDKTIIRAHLTNAEKLKVLQKNLAAAGLTVTRYETISELIAHSISSFYTSDYFLIYQASATEYFLMLAKASAVYLTAKLKGAAPDLQKIINYSPLYFQKVTSKLFVPQGSTIEPKSTAAMEVTPYQSSQIAASLNQPLNLPLPVLGFLLKPSVAVPKTAIIKDTQLPNNAPMENKKNILPLILVFVITAAIASLVLWMVTRRSASQQVETPTSDVTATPEPTVETPTDTPVPTLAAVSKTLKIQVQNATDINGQAAKVKAELVALGFKSVSVGNAKAKATQNQIGLKSTSESAGPYFQQQLPGFTDAALTNLKDNSTYDVVVIIGTDLSQFTSSITPAVATTVAPTKAVTKKVTPTPTKATAKTTVTPTGTVAPTTTP